jgi:predicted nucleotidyltransferase
VNEPLQTTLADAAAWLRSNSVRFALVGGLAASLRGQTRTTAAVDMIIAADAKRALALAESLDTSPFKPLFQDFRRVVETSLILPLRHRSTNIKLDLALGISGFEQQAIARAEIVEMAGVAVPVVTSEDLLIMKVLAGRPQDDQDVRGLVIAQGDRLDWKYCLRVVGELGQAIGQDLAGRIRILRGAIDREL